MITDTCYPFAWCYCFIVVFVLFNMRITDTWKTRVSWTKRFEHKIRLATCYFRVLNWMKFSVIERNSFVSRRKAKRNFSTNLTSRKVQREELSP